ncbi:MAG: hypothetical protein NW237_02750 [Cyanobacteriota bacterium]|nr:hypothetical protein [Cyanobacteriota bacterium]
MNWLQSLSSIGSRGLFWVVSLTLVLALNGFGGRIPLQLKDLQTVPCPDTEEYSHLLTSGAATNPADCYFIQGTVINKSGRTLLNADVFGRIYDANGNDLLPERTRLGAIEEVPPGENPFSIRISVPQTSRLPLSLEQFKAAGFGGTIRR